ncbi:MAG: hypothetical protein ACTSSR_00315 [Alphaproteobacteria bacterium]
MTAPSSPAIAIITMTPENPLSKALPMTPSSFRASSGGICAMARAI